MRHFWIFFKQCVIANKVQNHQIDFIISKEIENLLEFEYFKSKTTINPLALHLYKGLRRNISNSRKLLLLIASAKSRKLRNRKTMLYNTQN